MPATLTAVDRLRPPTAGEGWQPAIDGLRGVAVLAVLLYHADPDLLPGGYLGVSLFFTLSGYLITTLLLRERERTGGISIARFWVRRARRLVPVALAGLALATLVAWWTLPSSQLESVAADVRWAAVNLANWHELNAGTEYGDVVAAPSPVTHYWSLAIEEQFYLVFPLVAAVALRFGRRALGAVLVLVTVGSLAAQVLASTPNRAYLGTASRLSEITIGALLALVLAHRPAVRRSRRALVDGVGLVALGLLAAAWLLVPLGDLPIRRGALVVHALLACVVLVAVLQGRLIRGWLSEAALVALGLISYGVYVVHFPLFLLLTPERVHVDGIPLIVLRLVASVAAAAALHALVERPVRWGASLRGWQGGLSWLTATAAIVVVGIALPQVPRTNLPTDGLALNGLETTVVTMPDAPAGEITDVSATPTTAPASSPSGGSAQGATPGAAAPGTSAAVAPAPPRALRLLVVGDSTAASTGNGIQRWAKATGRAAVDVVSGPGCAFEQTGYAVLREGWELPARPACLELLDTARDVAQRHPPDAVIVFIGSTQVADWRLNGAPTTQWIGQPAFEARYIKSANTALAALEALGAPVLWTTVPVPDWDPSLQLQGQEPPGKGELTMNDARRTARLNQLNQTIVRAHPLVRLVPYAELISAADGSVDTRLRPDGLHLSPDQVPGLMGDGLEALLRDGYRSVLKARPALGLDARTAWSS